MAKFTVVKQKAEALSTGLATIKAEHLVATSTNADAACQFFVSKTVDMMELTIIFDANGGEVDTPIKIGIVGQAIGELPTPVNGDNHFAGWINPAGDLVTADTILSFATKTLVAVWVEPTVITFDAGDGTLDGASTIKAYVGYPLSTSGETFPKATGPSTTPSFSGWYNSTDFTTRITSDTIYDGSYTTLYAKFVNTEIRVDMGYGTVNYGYPQYGFMIDESINPNPDRYDGVYCSTNTNIDYTFSAMRIYFKGFTTFKVLIRSNGETNYDYSIASYLDSMIPFMWNEEPLYDENWNPVYDENGNPIMVNRPCFDIYAGGYHSTTHGNKQSGEAIENYTEVVYTVPDDGLEHFVDIAYIKDSGVTEGTDMGYVLIDKETM